MLGSERAAVWSTLGGECRAFFTTLGNCPKGKFNKMSQFQVELCRGDVSSAQLGCRKRLITMLSLLSLSTVKAQRHF